MGDDDEGWGQRRARVEFPDEAITLCLPIEIAIALYFAKRVAVEARGRVSQESKARSRVRDQGYMSDNIYWKSKQRQLSGSIKSEVLGGRD